MPSAKVSVLTKQEISVAAKNFQWSRRLPKWTVVVDGRQLPARPLVLEAAGVPPNDPTNSHQAVALLQDRGFPVYYEGKAMPAENKNSVPKPVTDEVRRWMIVWSGLIQFANLVVKELDRHS